MCTYYNIIVLMFGQRIKYIILSCITWSTRFVIIIETRMRAYIIYIHVMRSIEIKRVPNELVRIRA